MSLASVLAPTSPVLPNTAAVIAVLPLGVGIRALIQPESIFPLFGITTPTEPRIRKVALNQARLFAIRELFMSFSTLTVWWYSRRASTDASRILLRETLGWFMAAATGVAFVDGWVTKLQIGKNEWTHWGLIPVSVTTAGGLLGWLDPVARLF